MSDKKEIKICPACTKFDRDSIEKVLTEKGYEVRFGCLVYCRDKDETQYPYFALVNGKLVEKETYEDFIAAV